MLLQILRGHRTLVPAQVCNSTSLETDDSKSAQRCPLSWNVVSSAGGPAFQAEYQGTLGPKDTAAAYLRLDVVVSPLPDPTWDLDK